MRAAAAGHSIQYGREGRTTRALLLREHRFAAITPLAGEGAVLTKQLTFLGSSLKVNAQCDYGLILVELLDVKFHPYPGFAAGDCQPVHGGKGQIWHQVVWNNGASVKSLHGKPVRIRFVLKEASIFGFQFF